MSTSSRLSVAALMVATLALPSQAFAAAETAACSVAIDYSRNNVIVHACRQEFMVQRNTPYRDDFSSPIRMREFNAAVSTAGGEVVVSIDYFNEAGDPSRPGYASIDHSAASKAAGAS